MKIKHRFRFYSPDDLGGIVPPVPEPVQETVQVPAVVVDQAAAHTQQEVAPLIDPVHDKLDRILSDTTNTRERVAALEARLDERTKEVPAPIATPTISDVKEAVSDAVDETQGLTEGVPDAVEMTVEDNKPPKPKEEKKRKKRGLRR